MKKTTGKTARSPGNKLAFHFFLYLVGSYTLGTAKWANLFYSSLYFGSCKSMAEKPNTSKTIGCKENYLHCQIIRRILFQFLQRFWYYWGFLIIAIVTLAEGFWFAFAFFYFSCSHGSQFNALRCILGQSEYVIYLQFSFPLFSFCFFSTSLCLCCYLRKK